MHIRLADWRPIIIGHHRWPILRRLSPVRIPWINSLVHWHHWWLVHVIVDRWLHHWWIFIVVWRIIVDWKWTVIIHVHTWRAHLISVHRRIHAVHVGHIVWITVIVWIHVEKSTNLLNFDTYLIFMKINTFLI
jgi:hypothetical protein